MPAQTQQQKRLAFAELAAVRADRQITGEALLVLGHEIGDLRAADLFLAFEAEFQVDRRGPRALQKRFHGQDRHEHIPLVVGRAAGIDPVSHQRRFKGRMRQSSTGSTGCTSK